MMMVDNENGALPFHPIAFSQQHVASLHYATYCMHFKVHTDTCSHVHCDPDSKN